MSNTVYINVGGTWKEADAYYVNVDGTWKTGSEFQIKIGSDWKGEAAASGGLPTYAQILGLDYVDFSLPTMGTVDSGAHVGSLGLDFTDFTLPIFGKANPAETVIVSTNLKLHLDAGDSDSYIGSGTTWIDLSSGITSRSVEFDGTDDALTTASSSDFDFGSGDFTVEAWFYPEQTNSENLSVVSLWNYNDGKRAWSISGVAGSSSTIRGMVSPDGAWATRTEIQGTVNQNQWNHVAFTRSSNTLYLFINGASAGTASYTGSVYNNTSDGIMVGGQGAADDINTTFDGKISNVRVVKGTAVYTSAFTTPTEPLTNITNTKLLCCNNANVTGSTVTPGTITAHSSPTASILNPFDNQIHGTISGATYSSSDGGIFDFDGMGSDIYTGDHVITAHSSDFDFGSGDFTIEAWCKPTNASQVDPSVVSLWNFGDGRRSWGIFGDTSGSVSTYDGSIRAAVSPDGAFATRTEITGSLSLNNWNHIVFTRISNTLTFYINNSAAGTASFTGSVYSNTVDGLLVGAMGDSSESRNHFAGDIAQVRIYKGTGLTSTQVNQNYWAARAIFGL